MTKKQKELWERSQEFKKDIAEEAEKECDLGVYCDSCGKCIGYANKELYFEDFLKVCINCGEKND